jgi:menaquinone-dependent protoporphyrinogen oxidase
MKTILVLYATREGHTRRIAEYVAANLRDKGFSAHLVDARLIPVDFSIATNSAAILAASVHAGKHEPEAVGVIRRYRTELEQMPAMFLSVSLSQAGAQAAAATSEQRNQAAADVKAMISLFLNQTGWHPTRILAVAGALMYSKYNFLIRFIMKRTARRAGASTDTSRDHEFTDWAALDRALTDFVAEEVLKGSHLLA